MKARTKDYEILYLFKAAIFDNFYIVEIKRNIETANKEEKYYWFFIDISENTISKLDFIEMKKKNDMEIRMFKGSKLRFNKSIAMYENNTYRAIYVTLPSHHIPNTVSELIDEYLS